MTEEIKEQSCLYLIAENGKWAVKEHLKPLKPVYNGAGWFIDGKHRDAVTQISQQANMRCLEWPLNGETFEELRRRHKAEFFQEKSIKLRLLIDGLKETLGIKSIDVKDLVQGEQRDTLEKIPEGRRLLEHADEYDRLQEQLKRIEEEEKIANISLKNDHHFQYLLDNNSEEKLISDLKEVSEGISIGFTIGDIDIVIPGGAITIVAAPTSHGKTATLINFALGALKRHHNKNVYFFTYEESAASILCLFLNTWIGKDLSKNNRESIKSHFRNGNVEHIKSDSRSDFLKDKKAFFDQLIDNGRLKVFYSDISVEELIIAIKFIKANDPNVGMICIDYMQFLKLLKRTQGSRQEELKEICLSLKDCAVETGLPILLAAQFNRTVVAECDLSPTNIGEAGDIERAANMIIGMWNRNFDGFSRQGNIGKDGKKIAKESAIYFELMKGRGLAPGQSSVMDFNGNAGTISNRINPSKPKVNF